MDLPEKDKTDALSDENTEFGVNMMLEFTCDYLQIWIMGKNGRTHRSVIESVESSSSF